MTLTMDAHRRISRGQKFPFATANAGDSIYRGFTTSGRFALYETQVDHSGEIGLTYLKLYFFYHDKKYLDAAIKVADVLASNVRTGSLTASPWPYIVNALTGVASSEYGANWTGCYMLLSKLAYLGIGNQVAYEKASMLVEELSAELSNENRVLDGWAYRLSSWHEPQLQK